MKKLFIVSCFGLSFIMPSFATTQEPKVKNYSYEALGCVILQECKTGVDKVTVDYNFGPKQTEHLEEIKKIVKGLNDIEVGLYIADEIYFPHNANGIYKPNYNRLIIRKDLLEDEREFIKTLRHEGWHVVQDAMAGGIGNGFIAQVHQDKEIPEVIYMRTKMVYGLVGQGAAIHWESDANWAELQPGKTAKYLEMISVKPLWEQVEPTPMTKEWLVGCGFMKPEGKYKLYSESQKKNECVEGKK